MRSQRWSQPWHKTRDVPPSLCYPLTPGPARVSCHGVPAGFVSPPLPPDIRQGGNASPHRTPAPEGGASTIRVKFQIAALTVPKLVEVYRFLHLDLRSSFGMPFQVNRRILTLARDG